MALVLLVTVMLFLVASGLGQLTLAKWPLLIGELTLVLPAFLYLKLRRFSIRKVFRLSPVSWRVTATSVMLGFAITIVAIELDNLVNLVMPFPEQWEELLREALFARNLHDWIVILLASVFFAGTFEEMLFRGFVQNAFEQRHDALFAIFATAILFGFVHLTPWWFLQLIFISMFLGVMAWRSDSIIPSAIVHAQNNLIAVLLVNLAENQLDPILNWNGHVHPIVLAFAAAVLYFGMKLFFRFCEEDAEIPTFLNTPV